MTQDSELQALIEEQAEDMRFGHKVIHLCDLPGRVMPLDSGLIDRIDQDGNLRDREGEGGAARREAFFQACEIHGLSRLRLYMDGTQIKCLDCQPVNQRRYNQSEKGVARRKAYESRPDVRARRNARARERRRRGKSSG